MCVVCSTVSVAVLRALLRAICRASDPEVHRSMLNVQHLYAAVGEWYLWFLYPWSVGARQSRGRAETDAWEYAQRRGIGCFFCFFLCCNKTHFYLPLICVYAVVGEWCLWLLYPYLCSTYNISMLREEVSNVFAFLFCKSTTFLLKSIFVDLFYFLSLIILFFIERCLQIIKKDSGDRPVSTKYRLLMTE